MSYSLGSSLDTERARRMPDAGAEPVLGFGALLEIFDGDCEAVSGLLETASTSIAHDLERIEAAAACGDARAMLDAAHRLTGTSGSISATRLSDASSSIERAAKQSPLPPDSPLIGELQLAVAKLRSAIASFINQARDVPECGAPT